MKNQNGAFLLTICIVLLTTGCVSNLTPEQRQAIIQQNLAYQRQVMQDNQNAYEQNVANSQRNTEIELNSMQHVFDNDSRALSTPQPPIINTQSPPMIGAPSSPALPSAYEMQSAVRTGNSKWGPDGKEWQEWRTASGVTFWQIAQ